MRMAIKKNIIYRFVTEDSKKDEGEELAHNDEMKEQN
jgi:hypothetical protein